MKIHTAVIILIAGTFSYLVQIEGRRSKWELIGDAFIKPWEDMQRFVQDPSYRYWHHKKDSNGRWNKRKYGHSDSGSRSSEESRSSSRSSESRYRSAESFSGESKERVSKLPLSMQFQNKQRSNNDDKVTILFGKTFIFFVERYGCKNLTAFQTFLASYNLEHDKASKNELLKEISTLAEAELDRQGKSDTLNITTNQKLAPEENASELGNIPQKP